MKQGENPWTLEMFEAMVLSVVRITTQTVHEMSSANNIQLYETAHQNKQNYLHSNWFDAGNLEHFQFATEWPWHQDCGQESCCCSNCVFVFPYPVGQKEFRIFTSEITLYSYPIPGMPCRLWCTRWHGTCSSHWQATPWFESLHMHFSVLCCTMVLSSIVPFCEYQEVSSDFPEFQRNCGSISLQILPTNHILVIFGICIIIANQDFEI